MNMHACLYIGNTRHHKLINTYFDQLPVLYHVQQLLDVPCEIVQTFPYTLVQIHIKLIT